MAGMQYRKIGFMMDYLRILDIRFHYRIFHQRQGLWFMTAS